MTDLTEQMKKGELPNGWYWCECYNEEIKILYYNGDCFELDDPETKNYYFFLKKDSAEIEILEKEPSYEEWQLMQDDNKRLKHDVGNLAYKIKNQRKEIERQIAQNAQLKSKLQLKETAYDFDTSRLEEENAQLKELLKECRPYISRSATSRMIKNSAGYKKDMKLFTKIDEALK